MEWWGDTGGNVVTPVISFDSGATSETLDSFSTNGVQRIQRNFKSGNSRKAQSVSVQLTSPLSVINSNGTPSIKLTHLKLFYDLLKGQARVGQ